MATSAKGFELKCNALQLLNSCTEMVRLATEIERVQEQVRFSLTVFEGVRWKRTKTQQRSHRDVTLLKFLIRCDMGEAKGGRVRLDEINKRSRNVTTFTG